MVVEWLRSVERPRGRSGGRPDRSVYSGTGSLSWHASCIVGPAASDVCELVARFGGFRLFGLPLRDGPGGHRGGRRWQPKVPLGGVVPRKRVWVPSAAGPIRAGSLSWRLRRQVTGPVQVRVGVGSRSVSESGGFYPLGACGPETGLGPIWGGSHLGRFPTDLGPDGRRICRQILMSTAHGP